MAKGQFQISKGSYGVDAAWESTPNPEENTSTVTVQVYIRYYAMQIGSRTCRCTLDGQTQEVTLPAISHSGSAQRKLAGSFTFTLPHEADGSKRCHLSAGFHFDLTSGNYGYIGWLEATGEITLDTIPRAATLTATGGYVGGNAQFSWTPGSESHSYRFLLDTGKVVYEQEFPGGSLDTQTLTLPLPAEDYLEYLTGTPPQAAFFATLTTLQAGEAIGSSRAYFTVTLPPYTVPALVVGSCHRANADGQPDTGGTQLSIAAQVTGSPYPKDSVEENALSLWLDTGMETQQLPLENGSFSGIVPGLTLDTTQVYHLSFWAEDLSDRSSPVDRDIPTAYADFHLRQGGKGAAFGCYATRENALQLAPGWTLYLGDLSLEDYIRQFLS